MRWIPGFRVRFVLCVWFRILRLWASWRGLRIVWAYLTAKNAAHYFLIFLLSAPLLDLRLSLWLHLAFARK